MRVIFGILLVLPGLAFCCTSIEYMKDGLCCKMCGPGTRMQQNTECNDPVCQACEDGEYQDGYTNKTECKQQPSCDHNLNVQEKPHLSTKELSPCQCIPEHHCASSDCYACVRNTVCKPGEKVSKMSNGTSDTQCEPCPQGTFSNEDSATSCKPWTECSPGQVESQAGSSTYDRICEAQSHERFGIIVAVVVVIFLVVIVGIIVFCYKKARSGSACFEEKMQKHCPVLCNGINNNHQPMDDKMSVENEQGMIMPPVNVPQEDTEDPAKQDDNFKNGLSANGMPVDQDHSKTSLLSQPETSPSGVSYSGLV